MRSLAPDEITGLSGRVLEIRTLVWVVAKSRSGGGSVPFGFWTDGGDYQCNVIDALSGSSVSRLFRGGAIQSVGNIPLTSDIAVRNVDVQFSAIDSYVEDMIRTNDVRGVPVQIYRGFFDPSTRGLIAPARARFVGFVDRAPVTTGKEGDASGVTLSCVSHTRELTRKNPAVRSHESQIQRLSTDNFYKDTGVVGEWDIAWGENRKNAGGTPSGQRVIGFNGLTY